MQLLGKLRSLYFPIQPFVQGAEDGVLYREIVPDGPLDDVIYCFWELKTTSELANSYHYRVASDACIDIFFNRKNPQESFIMGFSKSFTQFDIGYSFDYFGIRFLPAAFPILFSMPAAKLANEQYWLKEIVPELATTIHEKVEQSMYTEVVIKTLQGILNSYSTAVTNQTIDERFYEALKIILQQHGHLSVEKNLNTGLGQRQLRRVFNHYIGVSPKSFCKVIRFQYVLRQYAQNRQHPTDKSFFDVGYYDQAHFIKDFKAFYGITPKDALR